MIVNMVGCIESLGGLVVIGGSVMVLILKFGSFYGGRKEEELDCSSLYDLIKFYMEFFDYFVEWGLEEVVWCL